MPLITLDELARGACIGIFGGLAGVCTVVFPGSPLWLAPAALAVGGCALTVPELRQEARQAWPQLQAGAVRGGQLAGQSYRQLTGRVAPARPRRQAQAPGAAADTGARPELLRTLEDHPHRLIIGHTRGGKTTLIHKLATDWAAAGERVLVGDPDAAPGLWPGCEVRGAGDNVASIGELLGMVQAEVEARRLARAQGVRRFAPLHLIIDEAHDVLPALDGGLELFEDVARRGGKLNIRMTVGVQDKQVKTLGLEGKSALLRNFMTADVLKTRDGRRVAVLRDPETNQKVSMEIPTLTDPESLIRVRPSTETTQDLRRAALVPVSALSSADDLLAALLTNDIPAHQDAEGMGVNPVPGNRINAEGGDQGGSHSSVTVAGGNGVPVTVNATLIAPQPATKDRTARTAYERALVEVYRALGAEGETFAKAYAQHKGTKEIAFTAWQEGRAQKGSQS